MKKTYGYFLAVFAVSLFSLWSPGLANAAVLTETGILNPNWTPWPSGGVEFETRLGDGTLSGDWELGHKFNGVTAPITEQFAIANGSAFNFTLSHDSVSGDFTLSLAGGPSTTWASGHPGEAVQEIWLLAKTSNTAYTSTVNTLALNGSPINVSLDAVNDKKYLKIYGEDFSDFSLQGTMNFSWTSGTPSGSHIESLISVTSFAPVQIPGPVMLESSSVQYSTLQDAYDTAYLNPITSGLSEDAIRIKAGETLVEDLHFDYDFSIALNGGYDETFETVTSFSRVDGIVTISAGTVTVSNLIIGPSA